MKTGVRSQESGVRAFTMIEIAISLAVIGFALVAIIGILPIGMSTQKANREETIINQDANVFLDAIRNGQQGFDDLTNYVIAITNSTTHYHRLPTGGLQSRGTWVSWYTYASSGSTLGTTPPPYPITNGFRIVGLLSTPKYYMGPPFATNDFLQNHVVALVRSMSGTASDKFPQNNTNVEDFAFSYRMISDVVPYTAYSTYSAYDNDWTNYMAYTNSANAADWQSRLNYFNYMRNFQNNMHDVLLTFRWPLLPNRDISDRSSMQTFRTMTGGFLLQTNEGAVFAATPPTWVFFFQPRNYVKAP